MTKAITADSLPWELRTLVLELSTACDLKCVMCGRTCTPKSHDLGELSEELSDTVMDSVDSHLAVFKPGGHSEVALHPKLLGRVCKRARAKVLGVHIELNTNGQKLERLIPLMKEGLLDRIIVSIESVHPPTYESIRVGGSWYRLNGLLRSLVPAFPGICWSIQTILMKSTIAGIPQLIRYAEEIGFHSVFGIRLGIVSPEMRHERVEQLPEDVVEWVHTKARIAVKLPGCTNDLVCARSEGPVDQPTCAPPGSACTKAFEMAFVRCDGTVYPCCGTHPPIGRINANTSLKDVAQGEVYQRLLKTLASGTFPKSCLACDLRTQGW